MADERKTIEAGFVGGGRIVCDGTQHYMIRPEHEKHGCAPETHVGPCLNPKACESRAQALAGQK